LETHGTDPLKSDTDADTLFDGDEVKTYLTDPLQADSDNDGIEDGTEISKGTDPNDPADPGETGEANGSTGSETGQEKSSGGGGSLNLFLAGVLLLVRFARKRAGRA
ncbi:MAG: MarR family transcriptional regulator, partial [Gammaproteobacteria bacterium]|nr:MarR family transcriptional regulator [Gammaproteobacteria bacterium]